MHSKMASTMVYASPIIAVCRVPFVSLLFLHFEISFCVCVCAAAGMHLSKKSTADSLRLVVYAVLHALCVAGKFYMV